MPHIVFTVLFLLAFSDELLSAVVEMFGHDYVEDGRGFLPYVDGAILLMLAVQGVWSQRREGAKIRLSTVLWWLAGAAITLAADVVSTTMAPPLVPGPHMAIIVSYVLSLTILFAASVNVSPLLFCSPRARARLATDWAVIRGSVPLIVGMSGVYFATMGSEVFSFHKGVDQEYYAQISQIIALLFVALGIELGYFRDALGDRTLRYMAIMSMTVLAVGEALALTAIMNSDTASLSAWHAYLAFIVTVWASVVAFGTVVWVLVARQDAPEHDPVADKGTQVSVESAPKQDETLVAMAVAGLVIGGVIATLGWHRRRDS